MYLLDTNILIDFMHGRLRTGYELIQQSNPKLFKMPAIVAAELLLGAEKARNSDLELWRVECLLEPFEIVPFDEVCARHYAKIRAKLEAKGTPIGPNDLVIAATALAHHSILVTNNLREFQRVPGLSVECWGEIPLQP